MEASHEIQKRASDPITGGCEPPCGYWELNSGSLEEQSVSAFNHSSSSPALSQASVIGEAEPLNTFLFSATAPGRGQSWPFSRLSRPVAAAPPLLCPGASVRSVNGLCERSPECPGAGGRRPSLRGLSSRPRG